MQYQGSNRVYYYYDFLLVSLKVGDVVRISNFKSVVEKSFEGTSHAWSDQMRSMLGKDFPILEIRDGGIIALPSPNGQQNGKWYFHQRAVRKISGKSGIIIISVETVNVTLNISLLI